MAAETPEQVAAREAAMEKLKAGWQRDLDALGALNAAPGPIFTSTGRADTIHLPPPAPGLVPPQILGTARTYFGVDLGAGPDYTTIAIQSAQGLENHIRREVIPALERAVKADALASEQLARRVGAVAAPTDAEARGYVAADGSPRLASTGFLKITTDDDPPAPARPCADCPAPAVYRQHEDRQWRCAAHARAMAFRPGFWEAPEPRWRRWALRVAGVVAAAGAIAALALGVTRG